MAARRSERSRRTLPLSLSGITGQKPDQSERNKIKDVSGFGTQFGKLQAAAHTARSSNGNASTSTEPEKGRRTISDQLVVYFANFYCHTENPKPVIYLFFSLLFLFKYQFADLTTSRVRVTAHAHRDCDSLANFELLPQHI